MLPNIAVQQRVTDKLVFGGGLQTISGLGSDFRKATALQPIVELVVFGANLSAGYEITPGLSIGASGTIAFGLLEIGLLSNTGLTHTFGIRGGVGATYDPGPVTFGVMYSSPLELSFESVTETAPGTFSDFELQQPQDVVIGIATSPALWQNLVIEGDLIWKNWSAATAYEDIWDNQTIAAIGGQYSLGQWKVRLGYSYSSDLQKETVGNSIGNLKSLSFGGAAVPISPSLVQFVQATLTQPYWQQQVSGGLGFQLTDRIQIDGQAGYAFDGDRTIGGTEIEVNEFQAGFGVTWRY